MMKRRWLLRFATVDGVLLSDGGMAVQRQKSTSTVTITFWQLHADRNYNRRLKVAYRDVQQQLAQYKVTLLQGSCDNLRKSIY